MCRECQRRKDKRARVQNKAEVRAFWEAVADTFESGGPRVDLGGGHFGFIIDLSQLRASTRHHSARVRK